MNDRPVGLRDGGGDGLAEPHPHRTVGAGIEAGTGVEARQWVRPMSIVPAPLALKIAFYLNLNLNLNLNFNLHPGGDIAQGAIVVGRRLVVADLRPYLRRVLFRRFDNSAGGDICPRASIASATTDCSPTPLARQTSLAPKNGSPRHCRRSICRA